jgi:hypothetical protein
MEGNSGCCSTATSSFKAGHRSSGRFDVHEMRFALPDPNHSRLASRRRSSLSDRDDAADLLCYISCGVGRVTTAENLDSKEAGARFARATIVTREARLISPRAPELSLATSH